MNILSGVLNKKKMASVVGCEFKEVDSSLSRLASMGWLRWKKIKGKYDFTLFSEPIERELELSSDTR